MDTNQPCGHCGMPETPWSKLISPSYGVYIHDSCQKAYIKRQRELKELLKDNN